jgi:hypothetical protein
MQFLAAATAASQPATDRLHQIPQEFWVKVGLGILVIIVAVVVLRMVAKVNKVVLGIGVLLGASAGIRLLPARVSVLCASARCRKW